MLDYILKRLRGGHKNEEPTDEPKYYDIPDEELGTASGVAKAMHNVQEFVRTHKGPYDDRGEEE